MKKSTLLIMIALLGICMRSSAQKLEENQKDEFTGKSVKRTSWETLYKTMSTESHFSISQVDRDNYVLLRMMIGKVFSIDKGQELMFKLDNDEVVKLECLEYQVTCTGCGAIGLIGKQAQGIEVHYALDNDQRDKLKTHKVVKVRIYTTDGFIDQDMKDKNAEKLIACLNLIG